MAVVDAPVRADPRLIVPLDVPTVAEARALVDTVGEAVSFYKVGLELFATGGGMALAQELKAQGKQVFLDWKLHDIGTTVQRSAAVLAETGCDFLTVHAEPQVLKAAVQGRGRSNLKILGVTVLTSLAEDDLRAEGIEQTIPEMVKARARIAARAGIAGLVCSPLEIEAARAAAPGLLIVVPGIRPASGAGAAKGDQKRVATAGQAIAAGADYLVIGRPIRDAPDPAAAFEDAVREVEAAV